MRSRKYKRIRAGIERLRKKKPKPPVKRQFSDDDAEIIIGPGKDG